jgi:16S rRNA C967 or C1407 C5-methylase (RsmB/RsmF family)
VLLSLCYGTGGKVIGVDISPRMIGRVRTEIQKVGFNNAEVLIADRGVP